MALPARFRTTSVYCDEADDSSWLLFVRKELVPSEFEVTSVDRGYQFVRCGSTGRRGIPLTDLVLHVDNSTGKPKRSDRGAS